MLLEGHESIFSSPLGKTYYAFLLISYRPGAWRGCYVYVFVCPRVYLSTANLVLSAPPTLVHHL